MQPLQNCIGPTIHIGREILCLPYAGFFMYTVATDCVSKRLISPHNRSKFVLKRGSSLFTDTFPCYQ